MRLPEDWRSRACLMLVLVWGLAALCEALPLFPADAEPNTTTMRDPQDPPDKLAINEATRRPRVRVTAPRRSGISIEVTPWTAS